MKAKITYAQLQERVAAAARLSKNEAQSLLKELTAAVVAGLVADGKVNLSGLGRFSRKVQSARRGRNPQTGEPIGIPEKNRVHFLPDAKWRRHVNRTYEQMPAVPAPPFPAPTVKAMAKPISEPGPAAADTPPPDRKANPSRPAGPEEPVAPVDTETVARAITPPEPQTGKPGDIPPEEKTGRKRRIRLAPAVGVMLLLATALFFLWPRSQPPVSPEPVSPETARTVAGKTPRPPETSRPEPEGQAAFETAAVEAAEAAPPKPEPEPAKPATVSRYTVAAGDSLWKIANTAYDYPYFWPVIFRANHADIQHPDTLTVGMRLAIPAFTGRVGRLVESDFQQLADGYLHVYRVYRRHHHPRAPYYLWVAYRLRAHWVPAHELLMGKPEDREFINRIKGRGLIH